MLPFAGTKPGPGSCCNNYAFKDKMVKIKEPVVDPATGKETKPATFLRYGNFINAVINFLIVAFSVFLLVKAVNHATKKVSKPPPPGEPTNKECPMCTSSIPFRAKKCPQCTADLLAA